VYTGGDSISYLTACRKPKLDLESLHSSLNFPVVISGASEAVPRVPNYSETANPSLLHFPGEHPVLLAGRRMRKTGVLILFVASSIGLCSCNGQGVGFVVPTVHAQTTVGFVNQSINQMDSTHWYDGAEAVFDPWGKSGGGTVSVPIPVGKTITHFQGTASWYTNGNCKGPVLASLVDRDPDNYSHPSLIYPIILNSNGPGVQLWFDYSTPLQIRHDGLRIEAYGIPKGKDCTGDFEIQGVITAE